MLNIFLRLIRAALYFIIGIADLIESISTGGAIAVIAETVVLIVVNAVLVVVCVVH